MPFMRDIVISDVILSQVKRCAMYLKRHIEQAVLNRAKMKGAVVVTGARQVGKTTHLNRIFQRLLLTTCPSIGAQLQSHPCSSISTRHLYLLTRYNMRL